MIYIYSILKQHHISQLPQSDCSLHTFESSCMSVVFCSLNSSSWVWSLLCRLSFSWINNSNSLAFLLLFTAWMMRKIYIHLLIVNALRINLPNSWNLFVYKDKREMMRHIIEQYTLLWCHSVEWNGIWGTKYKQINDHGWKDLQT